MKHKERRLEWAASLLAAGLVWGPLFSPISRQQFLADRILHWMQKPSLTDWLLVFVGAGQILILSRQSRISSRQVETIERLERPLLLPVAELGCVGYRHGANKSVFPVICMDFENYGRSPALVDCWHVAIVVGISEPDRFAHNKKFYSTFMQGTSWETSDGECKTFHTGAGIVGYKRMVATRPSVAPGDRLGSVDLNEMALNPQQVTDIANGIQSVWLDGFLIYADVWGVKRETHFKWKYELQLDLFIRSGEPSANRYT